MLALLNREVCDHVENWRRDFASARPFRHVVIDAFLSPEFCAELIAGVPAFEARYSLNETGDPGRKAVIPQIARLGPAYARFDALMRDPEFLDLISRITGIPSRLYDPDYAGGGTHENLEGQELDPYVDFNYHPTRGTHRRLNLIVFLNREWDERWGGCLELLQDPWSTGADSRRSVLPAANRAVIFETTESSWHGFPRIQLPPGKPISRRSLAVYFYTAERPSHQVAPSHGTIYYQRPPPERIRAGYTLREDDTRAAGSGDAARYANSVSLRTRAEVFAPHRRNYGISLRIGRALTWPARALGTAAGKILGRPAK